MKGESEVASDFFKLVFRARVVTSVVVVIPGADDGRLLTKGGIGGLVKLRGVSLGHPFTVNCKLHSLPVRALMPISIDVIAAQIQRSGFSSAIIGQSG